MLTTAAVLERQPVERPYTQTRPLDVRQIELEPPGEGEVLVEVASAGLCHSDLSVINGSLPRPMPIVLGHEASGIVQEIGPGVRGVKRGDHVVLSWVPSCHACRFCLEGRPNLCETGAAANAKGTLMTGAVRLKGAYHLLGVSGFARHAIVAQESLITIEPDFPLDLAALFGCAVVTGVGAVINTARVEPGRSVAVFGAGGVGLSVVMGARLAGADPIVVLDLLESKRRLALDLGATHVIDASRDDAVKELQDLTHGGADYAFDAVGSAKLLESAFRATRRGGTTVAVGLAPGDERLSISPVVLVLHERTLKGSYMGSAVPAIDIPRLMRLYRAGKLPVDKLVSRTLPLDQINDGFEALATGEVARQLIRFG
ncbi:MAG TPA: zinc-dependent alcohol dehydrogenase family protein [Chloroflexota bacterium]|nr:zinc-dependent alcohol dehydrogenase family protein [Chloroflexota bacterium]